VCGGGRGTQFETAAEEFYEEGLVGADLAVDVCAEAARVRELEGDGVPGGWWGVRVGVAGWAEVFVGGELCGVYAVVQGDGGCEGGEGSGD
jgi:hypothetical protein